MDRITLAPKMLSWARERAGYSIDMLRDRFPKLTAWEQGATRPTLKQLEAFATAMHVPVGLLFLQEPPEEPLPIPDFRTFGSHPIGRPSPDLLDTVYLCQMRQTWYRDFAVASGQAPLRFVGSARTTGDVVATAARMRKELGFELEERRRMATWEEALRRFIERADASGVLVMVSGVVGSNNRRKLDVDEFCGFALADERAPLVFLNGSATKAAQMFTLAHELAHIWLGQSALSDIQPFTQPGREIERWCNQVAAELLVPLEIIRHEFDATAALDDEVVRLARRYKVSTLVVLRRIHDAGGLSWDDFRQAYARELARLLAISKDPGGDFYRTLGAHASKTFARALVISTLEGRTPFTEAFRLLGFKKMSTFRELGHRLGVAF